MMRQPSSFAQLHAWHRDAIAGFPVDRHDGIPEAGWYRMRRVKGGPWVAVQIVCERDIDDETGELTAPERLVALFDGERRRADTVWTYVEPISRDEYRALLDRAGRDERMAATMVPMNLKDNPTRPPRRAAMNSPVKPSDVKARDDAPPPRGHNNPPPYDPEAFAALVNDAKAFADAGGEWLDLKKIETEEQAQYLVDFIDGARKKLKDVEAWRKDAKRPHDEAGKAVQDAAAKPKGFLESSIKKALDLLTPYQVEQKRKREEEARRREEEARRQKEEADRLAAQAAARNDIAGEVEAERQRKEAEKAEKAAQRPVTGAVGSATGGGRTVGLVTVRSAVIDSPMQVFMFFRDRPEVLDVLQRLANGYVRAASFDGKPIPGTHTITEEKAR